MNDTVPAIQDRIISAITPSQGARFRALLSGNARNRRANRKTKSTKRFETATRMKKSAPRRSTSESNKPDKN